MRINYPKMGNMTNALSLSVFIAFKGTKFLFLFAIIAAGVVPCGSRKMYPRVSFIVQIIFYFWSFEINGNILRI